MKLLQLSTERCSHCHQAASYINNAFNDINHEVQWLDDKPSTQARELATVLQTRGVPHFVVLSSDKEPKIIDHFTGFDKNKIMEYAENFKINEGKLEVDNLEVEDPIVEDVIVED